MDDIKGFPYGIPEGPEEQGPVFSDEYWKTLSLVSVCNHKLFDGCMTSECIYMDLNETTK
jgi:hypothetical protein